jgi:hypothetical protein
VTHRSRRLPTVLALLLLLAGCALPALPAQEAEKAGGSPETLTNGSAGGRGTAIEQLDDLVVKGRAPMTGYDRDRFGAAWLDTDRNGCDTRNDMLGRDLTHRAYEAGTHNCVVVSGDLADPYTATRIHFVKGDGNLVDIDHVVALGNAWATGAFRWDIRKRAALANDPMNLLSVDASANRQKGDGDTATWLPANKRYRCDYVARQVGVKAKYRLWVTPAEKDAMTAVLDTCPDQRSVPDSGAPVLAPLRLSDPSDSPSGSGSATGDDSSDSPGGSGSTTGDDSSADSGFASCDEARAAGAAPLHRGDPGYSSRLDRDGDGDACE